MIRANLSRFLRTARQYSHYGPFWIDALCINQDDNTEKSQQAAIVDEIYSKAESVVVWLGLTDEQCQTLRQTLVGISISQAEGNRS